MGRTVSVVPAPAVRVNWRAALDLLDGAYSPRTLYELAGHFGHFEAWCIARGVSSLPASAEDVVAHIEEVHTGMSVKTARIRLMYIRRVHLLFHHPDPTRGHAVWLAQRRGARLYGARETQAAGLTYDLKEQVLDACPAGLQGLRDRAMYALAYDTLCRAHELVRLQIEDLQELSDGTASVIVRQAKNDPFSERDMAFLTGVTLAHVRRWLQAAHLQEGAILRRVRGGFACAGHLSSDRVGRRLRELAVLAGIAPDIASRLTGHSPRVGAAQDLAVAGCSMLQVMRAGRWRDPSTAARYARKARVNVWTAMDQRNLAPKSARAQVPERGTPMAAVGVRRGWNIIGNGPIGLGAAPHVSGSFRMGWWQWDL
jgi:integrase/recombinase XerD